MDPDAALREIDVALTANDQGLARVLREDLLAWIANGGFHPEWGRFPNAACFCIFHSRQYPNDRRRHEVPRPD